MDILDCPGEELWEERSCWFDSLEEEYMASGGSYLLSEQACALSMDVRLAFCAGAWMAVIVLTIAVVDAQLRETGIDFDFEGNTAQLIDVAQANPELQEIRRRRNAIVHVNPESPAITVDEQWSNRHYLENDARKAVRLMFEVFFMNPGV